MQDIFIGCSIIPPILVIYLSLIFDFDWLFSVRKLRDTNSETGAGIRSWKSTDLDKLDARRPVVASISQKKWTTTWYKT